MDIPRKNQKRKRWLRRGLLIIIVLLLVGATTVGLSRLEPAVPSVDRRTLWVDTVKRGPMLREVRGVGTLMSQDVLVVPAEVAGRVRAICVEPGAVVDANTVILELTNPQLQLQWLDAQSKLNSAKAQLSAEEAGLEDKMLEIKANQAKMEADLRMAQLTAEVDANQFEDGLISKLSYDLSQARVETQESMLKISKQRWTMFREKTYPAQLAGAQATLNQAQSQFNLTKSQIDSLFVRAGTGGVLASVKDNIELGQSVSAGTILARITNPKRLKARLRIPEVQARDVRIGLKAEIDTYNGKIPGRVSRLDPTVMEGNVTVDIALNGALPDGARPDLSVVGTVEIERLDDILYVGRPVFASSESTVALFKVVEEGKYAIRIRTELGRRSVSTIEVIEGLLEEDEIILSDMSQWDEQDRLRLK
ncbi:MAG: HlyD family efflux transporter periplasmic adaptor subunit [Planctomycetes bacterium]|nr:HlyD family efflux transporter periplasmic adaptor subunit [Planctomycetota bacterium]